MNHELLNVFPTLIYKIGNFLSLSQCNDIYGYLKKINTSPHGLILGDAVSSYNINSDILNIISNNLSSCVELKNNINNSLMEYSSLTGILHTAIDRSWINIQRPFSKLEYHTHPGSFITGALYINLDNKSSKIKFLNPNPFIPFTPIIQDTKYTNKFIEVIPEIGDMLLFPSWLLHGSDDINETEERIVISFNTGLLNENLS